ncbi:hypothetical protein Tco_0251585 [Tanacetum coccineum]
MISITAQQTKLDLELVPKENRLDIGKCNRRIPHGLKPKEETFQVVLDALTLTPMLSSHFSSRLISNHHTGVINSLNDVVIDQMHQPWRTFAAIINKSLFGKTSSLDKLCLSRAQRGMYHQKNVDYVELLWEDFTYQIDNKVYKKQEKMYYPREVPPKVARKFKKPLHSQKKSASKPATRIVIRDPHVETKSKIKEKEKVDVAHGKGIELLSKVVLSKKAQMKEARMKSLREFHKTHPSSSSMVSEKPPSVEKITPTVTSEGTGDKPGNQVDESRCNQENESEENQELDSDSDENTDDDDQEQEDFDQTTHMNLEMNEINKLLQELFKEEGNDTEMTEAQQGNENLETTQEQVVEDAHVTISTVPKKTEVPVTSSSRSSDLAYKFLNFLDIPQTDAEIVSPLDVHVHHEVPRTQAPTLLTIPVLVIPESSPKRKPSKDVEPTTGLKKKDSTFGSSKGTKSQPKSSSKSIQSEEPVFEVADSDLLQDQEGNLGDNKDEPKNETAFLDVTVYDYGDIHIGETTKSFYLFAQRYAIRGEYLEEIVMRRADNALYRFKEGDDVADFTIALRMFTRSLVIQKRVEDLQLRVESYQKKIKVTKPDTTRPDLRKRHSYTLYKYPQGFIYVDDHKRNRLMRSDELYKFSDGTLTKLLSSLDDITKNIDMEYLPKRRWSNFGKEKSSFHDQGHQQAAKGKEDDDEFGEIRWW